MIRPAWGWGGGGSALNDGKRSFPVGRRRIKAPRSATSMLRFLVNSNSPAALANINAVNAASVRSDAPTVQGQPDNGDHISTADAILVLRRVVKIVDAFFNPCGQQVCQ